MPYMTRILPDLVAAGLDVEVIPGWQVRGSISFAPGGVVDHWTAGPRGSTGRPSLTVVTFGRPGLLGPLCNVYLDRSGVCIIVAAGRANHAGKGGWQGLVGNSSVYGVEAESAGSGDWTARQREVYPVLNAALLRGLGRGPSWVCGHNEWAPTRKIDIRDWPMPVMRDQTAAYLAAPVIIDIPVSPPRERSPQEDDVIPFIIELYQRFLSRPGTTTEWAGWADTFLAEGITGYVAMEERFKRSKAETGSVVGAFREILGRDPKLFEIQDWSDTETIAQVWDGVAQSPEARLRRGETI